MVCAGIKVLKRQRGDDGLRYMSVLEVEIDVLDRGLHGAIEVFGG